MKRGLLVSFVLIILMSVFTLAANDTIVVSNSGTNTQGNSDAINKAYTCLDNQVKNNTKLSFQEAIFSMLAIGYKDNIQKAIDDNKYVGDSCWLKDGCKIKETAQVALAYDRIHKNTDEIYRWLGARNVSPTDLAWYLEVDIQNHVPSQCSIIYDGVKRTINVQDDMTLSGSGGNCLTISGNGFWLRISNSCLDKEFEVSCDEDFVSSLLYQKSSGGTVFVSSETHSASALGTTKEKVKSSCFRTGSSCDYEGTLWAALAFQKSGRDVTPYLPYLLALSNDNEKYFPSTFLYILTSGDDYYTTITQNQKQGKFWKITSTNSVFYDTSLALLAIGSGSASEAEGARNYLLSIQTDAGCWNSNNIRDTAFILYSGWPRGAAGQGTGTGSAFCTEAGFSCGKATDCSSAGGKVLYDYECTAASDFCCSIAIGGQSCSSKNGVVCGTGEQCSGRVTSSLDGSCCLDTCEPVADNSNLCESNGGSCKTVCGTGEQDIYGVCAGPGQLCCATESNSGSGWTWFWIILLLILIILVIVAIIFRDKIRVWWYKRQGKASSEPVTRKPGVPPGSPGIQMRPQMIRPAPMVRPAPGPRMPQRVIRRVGRDTEMEETLKKLRDMTK